MNLFWFRDLSNLAQTGNFSQAAELSNLSQPALSRRIKAIETWVGAELVDRSRHPVALTSAGGQMLEAGQQALARLETERSLILETQSLPDRYVVTFGAQHSIGWRFYPSWLQAFEDAFGPIMSRLRADDLPNCMQDLEAGEVDFVIAYETPTTRSIVPTGDLESVLIGQDTLIPVSKMDANNKPMFDLGNASPVSIPYLRFGSSAAISQHIDPVLRENQLLPKLQVVYENSMAGALRIRAREGVGIAWLPKSLVAPDLDAGLLTSFDNPDWSIQLDIRLYRRRVHANSHTRKIWTFLSQREHIPLMVNS